MPPKKNAKKNKDDDWDDDAAEKKLAALKLKEAEAEEKDNWDDDDDEPPPPPKGNKGFGFAAMMDESEDEKSEKSDSEPEPEVVKKAETKKPEPKKQEKKEDKKKGKKNKKGKKEEDDEDIDAILANLDKPTEKQDPKTKEKEPTPVAAEEDKPAPVVEEKAEKDDEGDADAKKKKKKKKKDKKKGGDDEEGTPEVEDQEKEKKEGEEEGEDAEEGGEGEDKKKKKKKDKKKEKKKEAADDGKTKKKKHVDLIKELLRAKQEAEEAEARRIKEEEERLEALQKAKEEAARLEKEKREAKKLKEKQLIEKQKAEGTYMTAKEKEKARLAAAKLAAAGIDVAKISAGEGKPVIYHDKRSRAKAEKAAQKKKEEAASAEVSAVPTPAPSTPVPTVEAITQDDEPLDDWEMADEAEPTLPSIATVAPIITETVKKLEATRKQDSKDVEESSSEESSSEESSSEESSDEESSEDDKIAGKETKEEIRERVKRQLKKRREIAESKRSIEKLRAPVICVMGHVDTGKTKMLDTIRRTSVQEGEAGGITQQIGATQVPADAIKERCRQVRDFVADAMKIPGFLVIDTPGHESFSNLRSRGSSLCDFAILVVDIMHGLEPQTIESLKMLLKRKTPFVVALNKIDRLYGYESNPRKDVYQHLKSQPQHTQMEFKDRYDKIVTEFAEQAINVILSNKNDNREEYVSMVPTSAFLGDGIGNLMAYIVEITQKDHAQKLAFCEELDASVMEVKAISGLGTTIDVILVNGTLRVGDILVITGSDGAISTPIRDLLMPPALREIRVKAEYDHFKEVKGAQGVKILAKNLEKAIAGLPIFVAHKEEELDILREEADAQLSKALHAIKKKPEGVYVMASTLGSLEALLEFLKTQKIPYSNVNIGPVHKKDVQKAAAMKEHNKEYACVLAFDVKVERDAQIFADHEGVKIFQADIIYHLEDSFLKYREDLRLQARKENEHKAIFPCKLRVLPQHIFNARNPIVIGVVVEGGQLKRGTPICVPSKDGILLGTVASLQRNNEEVPLAKKGEEICIKIENTTGEAPKLYGRHFNHEDPLVSRITRESIDICKTHFRDDLSQEDWQLVVALKKTLDIM